MASRTQPANARLTALVLVAIVAGACSSGPQSQATTSEAPSDEASVAASEVPTTEPASEPPSKVVPTAAPSAVPTPLAIPPKPAAVTWKHIGSEALTGGQMRVSYRITWTSPEGVASTFSVYGVTECLRDEKRFDGKPCVVRGMKIPKRTLKLIAQVPGSARSIDIAWKEGEIGPGPYSAVLVRASNEAGDSIFTIAWSAAVCWQCTY